MRVNVIYFFVITVFPFTILFYCKNKIKIKPDLLTKIIHERAKPGDI